MMKTAIVPKAGAKIEIAESPIPNPGKGWVRIKVYSCGVCHTDIMMAKGAFPGLPFPVVPGHEVAGRIDEVGEGVTCFKKGDKVGVGYFGGSCHECKQCKQNQWTTCEKVGTTGISFRGGMAEYMIAPCDAVSVIPEEISFAEAGPLMCAGVTTFNSIRSMGIRPGEKVIIQGIGGLGHLAIQYARKMGYEVIAVSSNMDKEKLAKELGAHHYFVSSETANTQIQAMGGAKLIVCTAPSQSVVEKIEGALGAGGSIVIVAAIPELKINPIRMLSMNQSVCGRYSGDSRDSEDCLHFSKIQGVHPMIQKYKLDQVNECFENIGNARFRSVIVIRNDNE